MPRRSIISALVRNIAASDAGRSVNQSSPRGTRDGQAGFHLEVYRLCMARTNIDIDDEACETVMRRYDLSTKRDAVNYALRLVAAEALDLTAARAMRGTGWDGDLDDLRTSRVE